MFGTAVIITAAIIYLAAHVRDRMYFDFEWLVIRTVDTATVDDRATRRALGMFEAKR